MRNIADGIRLFLTAIVLAAVYVAFVPDANPNTFIVVSIILLGVVMIIFTFFGGMEAVIWVEVVQLGIYIGGAIAAAVVILNQIDGGYDESFGDWKTNLINSNFLTLRLILRKLIHFGED